MTWHQNECWISFTVSGFMYQWFLILIHSTCISDTDTDTLPKMYHDTWYMILFFYQDTYHDTCIIDTPQHCAKGYARQSATVTDIFLEADDALFRKILYDKAHVLQLFLPDRPDIVYSPDLIISLSYVKPVTSMNAIFYSELFIKIVTVYLSTLYTLLSLSTV